MTVCTCNWKNITCNFYHCVSHCGFKPTKNRTDFEHHVRDGSRPCHHFAEDLALASPPVLPTTKDTAAMTRPPPVTPTIASAPAEAAVVELSVINLSALKESINQMLVSAFQLSTAKPPKQQ